MDVEASRSEQFAAGSLVRLVALQGSPELNHHLGTVICFLEKNGRYEVSLWHRSLRKALRAVNLVPLHPLEEVSLWRDELLRSELRASEVRSILARLDTLQLSMDILSETKVGKVVSDLVKRYATRDIATSAKQLVRRWRDEYQLARLQKVAVVQAKAEPAQTDSVSFAPRPAADEETHHTFAAVPSDDRCMARVWNRGQGGQCSRRRTEDSELCGQHDLEAQQRGLTHGRIDGEIPKEKLLEFTVASVRMLQGDEDAACRSQPPPAQSRSKPAARSRSELRRRSDVPEIDPISGTADAVRLVNAMRNAPTERVRLGTLVALDRTPAAQMFAFIVAGGVAVLAKWLRFHGECRSACLTVLEKVPSCCNDLKEHRVMDIVKQIARTDLKQDNRRRAADLLAAWGGKTSSEKCQDVKESAPTASKSSVALRSKRSAPPSVEQSARKHCSVGESASAVSPKEVRPAQFGEVLCVVTSRRKQSDAPPDRQPLLESAAKVRRVVPDSSPSRVEGNPLPPPPDDTDDEDVFFDLEDESRSLAGSQFEDGSSRAAATDTTATVASSPQADVVLPAHPEGGEMSSEQSPDSDSEEESTDSSSSEEDRGEDVNRGDGEGTPMVPSLEAGDAVTDPKSLSEVQGEPATSSVAVASMEASSVATAEASQSDVVSENVDVLEVPREPSPQMAELQTAMVPSLAVVVAPAIEDGDVLGELVKVCELPYQQSPETEHVPAAMSPSCPSSVSAVAHQQSLIEMLAEVRGVSLPFAVDAPREASLCSPAPSQTGNALVELVEGYDLQCDPSSEDDVQEAAPYSALDSVGERSRVVLASWPCGEDGSTAAEARQQNFESQSKCTHTYDDDLPPLGADELEAVFGIESPWQGAPLEAPSPNTTPVACEGVSPAAPSTRHTVHSVLELVDLSAEPSAGGDVEHVATREIQSLADGGLNWERPKEKCDVEVCDLSIDPSSDVEAEDATTLCADELEHVFGVQSPGQVSPVEAPSPNATAVASEGVPPAAMATRPAVHDVLGPVDLAAEPWACWDVEDVAPHPIQSLADNGHDWETPQEKCDVEVCDLSMEPSDAEAEDATIATLQSLASAVIDEPPSTECAAILAELAEVVGLLCPSRPLRESIPQVRKLDGAPSRVEVPQRFSECKIPLQGADVSRFHCEPLTAPAMPDPQPLEPLVSHADVPSRPEPVPSQAKPAAAAAPPLDAPRSWSKVLNKRPPACSLDLEELW